MKLREIELQCRQGEITAQPYYRWREEYRGMNITEAKRVKELENENARLKRLVADHSDLPFLY